ncbi:MAG: phenylacetic acid degradation protein PaaY [Xanthobacteraceae bacterium]|nr:MAG: phenylacetic acid degradation protein PaaY [Xanthobacteraceae bacterium]
MTTVRPKVYALDGVVPVIHPTSFVHPDAVLIGDVIIEADCYIGPLASLRGDFGRIHVGEGSNIQDACTLHCIPGYDTVVGPHGHIGHGAIIHSAVLERNVLIGMHAVVMDQVVVGESAIVAAMSFVKARARVPARHLVAGVPARVVRELTADDLAMKVEGTKAYHILVERCRETLVPAEPLTELDADRGRTDATTFLPVRERMARLKERG